MGISRLKRLLIEDLSRTFNTRDLVLFIRILERDFDLYELSGYPQNVTIPRKDAANIIVDYYFQSKKVVLFLNHIFSASRNGFKGEKVVFNGLRMILKEMDECGYSYNPEMNQVVIKEATNTKRNYWGYLEEGKVYNFCFVSVDIAGNSRMVRKYNPNLIKETYRNFKKMVTLTVSSRNGRIWSWEGDGGLLVFHLNDFTRQAALCAIQILASMPVFNATANMLGEALQIRIGIHAGNAIYKNDTASIISDSIELTRKIEKNHTELNTISMSRPTFQHLTALIRNHFTEKEINEYSVFQLKVPVGVQN